MCDFKPGDEVVCVDAASTPEKIWIGDPPREGETYTVVAVGLSALSPDDVPVVWLAEIANDGDGTDDGYAARRFRKVERRNDRLTIEAFSVIKDGGFEEPKRKAPAKKRERA